MQQALRDPLVGGEKETAGGCESGSDARKGCMREVTDAIHVDDSRELPWTQGVRFDA